MMRDSYHKIFSETGRILVVMAHPDDNEIVCGGTVARLIDDDKKVRVVVMTNGGKGTKDRTDISEGQFAKIRVEEQRRAGKELGLKDEEMFNLGIPDGELEESIDNIKKIVFHIRQFKPEIIITHNPEVHINSFSKGIHWVNHRDHRHTASLVLDAAYPYSRDTAFFPDQLENGLGPHSVGKFLLSDSYTHPDICGLEVSGYLDKRRKALEQHVNGLSKEEVNGLMEEIQRDGGNFELLRYIDTD
ncbi:PIG-L family deacetylase [Patescibacteria group bacterium]|nr:PIG-L family deacetylase [Patescibacteria group bacterium]MBU1868014.1 PIG-L family deacetylase [Patescibacteria group bacterium]